MSGGSPTAAVLCGIGASVPGTVLTNDDLTQWLDTSDEWIRARTGVAERRHVPDGGATSDLAVKAGARALESAGDPCVDMVLLATTTPDRPCPATAPDVAARLGVATVPAFDLAAVCSGFVYGLSIAASIVESGRAERILLIAADTFSTILDPDDRTTVPVFGDGAGAVVLRAGHPDEPGAIGDVDLGSDGSLADLITVPAGGSRQRSLGVGPDADGACFEMDGRTVFVHAVHRMAESAGAALAAAGDAPDDIDRMVGHQANIRILRSVAQKLGLSEERLIVHLDRVGNTAAASVPLALADAVARGELEPGHRVLLSAFGGGATWGSTVLTWPDVNVP